MTEPRSPASAFERIVSVVMLGMFWAAFSCLAVGLTWWLVIPTATLGMNLLTVGLVGLLVMPLLRLVETIASAARTRDWMTVAATLAVLAILFALTLRDASRLR
jgi:hypothetical protein